LKKIIAVTLGEPTGVGPEIIEKALSRYHPHHPVVILGNRRYYPDPDIRFISRIRDVKKGICFYDLENPDIRTDESFSYVQKAVDLALTGKVRALVTAPISKQKWMEKGIPFAGHTGYLAHRSGVNQYGMFFWSGNLKVLLFTVHVSLKEIFSFINRKSILDFLRFTHGELLRLFGKGFVFFISGLNPHAGEQGHLGTEEEKIIKPALKELKGEMKIAGLYPPDTVFTMAREVKDSVVVCWYHDQGLIPFKLFRDRPGVNLTLGLPFIRTSPDHGTAIDIAGQGIADPASMIEAIKLADQLIARE
jgi:4-hydroxythreonine-4-phosphate dehydrogenase